MSTIKLAQDQLEWRDVDGEIVALWGAHHRSSRKGLRSAEKRR